MRLVKSAAAKWVPATRRWVSACEDTSMAQATSPAKRMRANSAWSSTAPGVVWVTGSRRPPTRASMVPMSPQGRPAASSTARMRKAEVVLPLVPVTPTTAREADGSPATAAAARAIDRRTSSDTIWGTGRSSSRSTISATAPRATASAAWSWPSARAPRTAQKREPGVASWARCTTEAIAASPRPGTPAARPSDPLPMSSWRVMRAGMLTEPSATTQGAILSERRENSAMSSNAGAATSPP